MNTEQSEYKITDTKTKTFGDLQISTEISDTEASFRYRLKAVNIKEKSIVVGSWCSHYPSPATVEINGRYFAMFTAYWDGTFPIEQPVEIVEGK